ncbi:MAG: O-acetylhomoserine aminocarboxypropyltransferase/cysteine synthase [Bacteroidales bacterium]|nr:O-acetylhomoserine aminocarboxypropyltransferase/cysteine synthase [Bacteroidales bacterium]MBR5431801.1 O-acetylhomoserine aminocarboxypropyltransferase/cysteine synthase [Bacteroidales bacterium]
MNKDKIGTLGVHAGYEPENGGPRQIPIIQSTTFKYTTSDQMGRLFDLEEAGYFYTRLQNPTNDHVAARLAAMEGGVAGMLTSSGQAANFFACFNICEAGGHMITTANIYGGTYNLFVTTFKKMGIDVTVIDQNASDEEFEKAFKPNTKLLFAETLTNPGVRVLDIERMARIAHSHGVPLIIDNTFPTPVFCRPIEFGADIVTHSTTKYIDGHGSSVGGAIVDSGNFPWDKYADKYPGLCSPDPSYHGLTYTKKFGKLAFITKATSQLMRDFGCIQSPQNAYYVNLGLQSLEVRVKRHNSSALKVARFLESHPAVKWVRFPELESDPDHALQLKYMPEGTCGVMAFALNADREFTNRFMDHLRLVTIETHVADAYTCILHPAAHTHRQLTDEQLREAGVDPDLMRLSIGLEDPEDLIADFKQAFEAAAQK